VAVLPASAGRTTLSFGLPAEGVHVQLEVDMSYWMIRETLTAPETPDPTDVHHRYR
jgi:hypothetical protein